MVNEQISDLIQAAHAYYAIGFAEYGDLYAGKQRWIQLLENKINNLDSASPKAWLGLVDTLKQKYSSNNVFDNAFQQFPGYSLNVLLSSAQPAEKLRFTRSLVIDVSLLCNYYTIFFEDRYVVNRYVNYSGRVTDTPFTILFTLSDKEVAETLASIHAFMATYYPDHQYVSHHTLFDIKIAAMQPYDIAFKVDRQYTAYDFLMSNAYHLSVPKVLP